MGLKIANNAHGEVASAVAPADSTITLQPGHGARFPALAAGDYFYATLISNLNALEIVKVTGKTDDVLTVSRAEDDTVAQSFNTGSRLEIRPVAALFRESLAAMGGLATVATTGDYHDLLNLPALKQVAVTGVYSDLTGRPALKPVAISGDYNDLINKPGGGGAGGIQLFNYGPGVHTFYPPVGAKYMRIVCIGGGGGGYTYSSGDNDPYVLFGGNGGLAVGIITSPLTSYSITVSPASGYNSNGGVTSFGGVVTATGGQRPPNYYTNGVPGVGYVYAPAEYSFLGGVSYTYGRGGGDAGGTSGYVAIEVYS